jgi:ubiquitin C-terminal hydrolase
MVVEHAYKQLRFWNFPKIVVIVFKRFSNSQQKNCVHIDFPHELDMSKYVVGYSPEKYKYGLFGVVNHMGGVHGGHYTAFTLTQEGAWVHCNDSSVSAVPSEHIVSENAYCLFYRQLVAQ